MTARLPIVGSDNNTWGTIENQFLNVSFNSDGTINPAALTVAGGITNTTSLGGVLSGTLPNPAFASVGAGGTVITGPSGSHPTVFQMPDGSILVVPLSFYSLSGDDSVWINTALTTATTGLGSSFLGGNGQVGGRVILWPNAEYTIQNTVIVPPGCELWGSRGTILAFSGTGPAIQSQGSQVGGQTAQGSGSRIIGITVDGTGVGGSAIAGGIEMGGQYDLVLQDVTVQNFTSTGTDNTANNYAGYYPLGAYGISICGRNTLCEKQIIRNCTISNCGPPNLTTTAPSLAGGAAIQFIHPASATIGTYTATSATPAVFSVSGAATPILNDQLVKLSGGTAPTGFTNGTGYYTVNSTGASCSLAATLGGSPIASTSTGSGTFTYPSAASGSHMYCLVDAHISQNQGQNGLVICRDGQPYYGSVRLKGNMFSTGSGNNGAATIVVGVGGTSTTVASGSNGGTISNIASWGTPSAGTLSVASTTGFPTSGSIFVATSTGNAVVAYTNTTGTTFTGCTYTGGSPTGTVATGGNVSGGGQAGHFSLCTFDVNVECTGGSGNSRPYSIWFGANVDNAINNSNGFMRFSNHRSASNSPQFALGSVASIAFRGQIWADTTLASVAAPVATPAAGTQYTNSGNEAIVFVSGSGVSNVLIGGVTTGLTSGPFLLTLNETIQINGGTPAWAWVTAVANG